MKTYPCPLCESVQTDFKIHAKNRDFFSCATCKLIFVSPEQLLNETQEKNRYNQHENNILSKGYKEFLNEIITPLLAHVKPLSHGLDFGSGPFPALAQLLREQHFKVDLYDPFYAKDESVFTKKYDFITLTEVAEHLYNPAKEFDRIIPLLKQDGFLAIMTSRTDTIQEFEHWYYIKDQTHVCFYADASIKYLAKKYHLQVKFVSDRVVIFQK